MHSTRNLIIGISAAGLLTGHAHAQDFAPPINYPVGTQPREIAIGDLNGDGILDMVVPNSGSDTITVMIGLSNSNFLTLVPIPVGDRPEDVDIADINGDGHQDIIVANRDSRNFGILLGDGVGGFAPMVTFPPFPGTARPVQIQAVDIDNDGLLDVVTSAVSGASLLVHLNNGDMTFTTVIGSANVEIHSDMAIADLDGDGLLDIMIDSPNGGLLNRIRWNLGSGQFALSETVLPEFTVTLGVAIGDVDSDGLPDIVFTDNPTGAGNPGNIRVIRNLGNRLFAPAVTYPLGSVTGTKPILIDLNGDGHLDVVVGAFSLTSLRTMINAGDGTFTPGPATAFGFAAFTVDSADFDGDNDPDIVAVSSNSGVVSVLFNQSQVAPRFLDHPESVLLPVGGGALELTFEIAGTGPLTYQWRRDGVELEEGGPFSGVNSPTLVVQASPLDNGLFDVIVTNAAGTATSLPAILAVRHSCAGDIADDFGTLGSDDQVSFGDFLALLGLLGPCP